MCLHELVHAINTGARPREELVERVHLAPVCILALFGAWQPAGHEEIPQLLQASVLAPGRLFRGAGFFDRKQDVRPVERREAESRLLAVGGRQAP